MKSWLNLILVLLASAGFAQNLSGTKWLLSSIDDLETGVSKDIGASFRVTLSFDSDTSYTGKFCNQFSGHYRHNKETAIKMGIPTATKLMCLGMDKHEKDMFSLFTMAHKYRIDKETLFIFGNHKRLTFKKESPVKASR